MESEFDFAPAHLRPRGRRHLRRVRRALQALGFEVSPRDDVLLNGIEVGVEQIADLGLPTAMSLLAEE